ncbi:MAG: phosphatase PAP2 family protein [Anaerolineae bacterium]
MKQFFQTHIMTLRQRISLHVVGGLIVSLICVMVFAKLADSVMEQEPLVTLDRAIADNLHAAATPATTQFFVFLSTLGYPGLFVMTMVAVLYHLWRRERLQAGIWLAAYLGGELLNRLLKGMFARPRPSFVDPLVIEPDFSFPSGHAMQSMIMLGLLAYVLASRVQNRRARLGILFVCGVLIALIGLSRIYLGVHYLSDVSAGFTAGIPGC